MKAEVLSKSNGAVYGKALVKLTEDPEALAELRAALAVVDKYKARAMKAANTKEKHADWTMVGYAVKSDCVLVTIEQGACG